MSFSRSFGDFKFKNSAGPLISIEPEVRYLYLDPVQDEFLILACDGLWDVFSSQEAVDFVRNRLRQMPVTEQDPQRVARELVNEAIYEKRSGDNVSVMVVTLTCGI
jgi:protein phosphatase 2C family protein 2/3